FFYLYAFYHIKMTRLSAPYFVYPANMTCLLGVTPVLPTARGVWVCHIFQSLSVLVRCLLNSQKTINLAYRVYGSLIPYTGAVCPEVPHATQKGAVCVQPSPCLGTSGRPSSAVPSPSCCLA